MPAVRVDNVSALPRIEPVSTREAQERRALTITDAPRMLEGAGFEVRRAFSEIDLRLADPFILLDHMGAVEYAPGEAKGAPDHPHRGFETVTYMMDGELEHRDSNGGGGLITDGATQWMTAGAGIVHSEMPTERIVGRGGLFSQAIEDYQAGWQNGEDPCEATRRIAGVTSRTARAKRPPWAPERRSCRPRLAERPPCQLWGQGVSPWYRGRSPDIRHVAQEQYR